MNGSNLSVQRREQLAAQARSAATNEELASVCVQLDVADFIFLGKVDLWLAKQALSAVYRTLKKYPALRGGLNYFGTLNGFIRNKEAIFESLYGSCELNLMQAFKNGTDTIALSTRKTFENNGLATAFNARAGYYGFSGIIINGKSLNQQSILQNLEYAEKVGHSPKGCKSTKAVIEHEIGHLLDYLLSVSGSREYRKFIKQYDAKAVEKGLSRYCVPDGNIRDVEVVAEAYSEYCNNPNPREIAMAIGNMIDKRYKENYGT